MTAYTNNPSMVWAYGAASAYLSADLTGVSTDGTPFTGIADTVFYQVGLTPLTGFPSSFNPGFGGLSCIYQVNTTITISDTGDATNVQAYFTNLTNNFIFYNQAITIPNSNIAINGSMIFNTSIASQVLVYLVLSGGTLNNAVVSGNNSGSTYPSTFSGIILRSAS